MLERLKDVTAEDLYQAIEDGTHTLNVSEDKDRKFGRKMARKFGKVVYEGKTAQELLTADLVLDWLCEDKPSLASLIINMGEKGRKWLEDDVKRIRDFLFVEEGSVKS